MEAAATTNTVNLYLIPLLPFLGAAVLILFGRMMKRELVLLVAAGAIGGAALVAFDAFFNRLPAATEAGGLVDVAWKWMATGDVSIDLAFRMDSLSGLLCLVVTFIGFLIHIYAAGYMEHDPDYARFFAYLNLFCGAMLVLVLGDSLPVMFIGWEGVGLCSYLLIGFWYSETANAAAGKKAFITNRVGDFGFLIGMFLLFKTTGTFRFTEITEVARPGLPLEAIYYGMPVAFWIGLFLFIGAAGKSAQIPLYVWLPDAMAGPTPVSALIHAATMVTAGVYMVARLHAVYMLAPAAMAIVALVGAATALFAAAIGFAQNDFKKVLAYSTVSQLGFMFVGVGTGNFEGGIFHLFTHAFFKAGLFLCAGSVMHAMSGSGDITKMGGLRKLTPITHFVFFVCWVAICGVPGFSGFFSKDAIVAGAFATNVFTGGLWWVGPTVGVMLLVAALGTAFYMSRLYFLVFSGPSRADAEVLHHVHESPAIMTGPLVVLAIGAVLGGLLGFPGGLFHHPEWNLLGHWLEPSLGKELVVSHWTEGVVMSISTVVAVLGIALAYVFYGGGYREPALMVGRDYPELVKLVRDKFRIDELYDRLIISKVRSLARLLFRFVDRVIIDRIIVSGVAGLVYVFGGIARSLQAGDGQRYLAAFVIGAAALVYMTTHTTRFNPFGLFGSDLKIEATGGTSVVIDATPVTGKPSPTRGLLYAFDVDGDGRPEHEGTSPQWRYTYDRPGQYKIKVTVTDPRWKTDSTVKGTVTVPPAAAAVSRGR